jgi:response regulator RpfG family c-di-GMP phosphodiesterase
MKRIDLMNTDDWLVFDDEQEEAERPLEQGSYWTILIVDDDPEIHTVTQLVLSNFHWKGLPLKFYHAYSAKEALEVLGEHDDIAVALVDVVMESDDAGLQLISAIRDQLGNHKIRLILRTGQPGSINESELIREYEINDYKNKTELTGAKLDTLLCTSLRTYNDLDRLEQQQTQLKSLVTHSPNLLAGLSKQDFCASTLETLTTLVDLGSQGSSPCAGISFIQKKEGIEVLSYTQKFAHLSGYRKIEELPQGLVQLLHHCRQSSRQNSGFQETPTIDNTSKISHQQHNRVITSGPCNLIELTEDAFNQYYFYLENLTPLNQEAVRLLDAFALSMSEFFHEKTLHHEINEGLQELLFLACEAIEQRGQRSSHHTWRVALMSAELASQLGMNKDEVEMIKIAASVHDLGKIAVPKSILEKPNQLDGNEWQTIHKHAEIGSTLLGEHSKQLLRYATTIALQHHERWDGSGYPNQLKGEAISLLGRITAVADAFDAMVNPSPYREPKSLEQALDEMRLQSGRQFDPKVLRAFEASIDTMLSIQLTHCDVPLD